MVKDVKWVKRELERLTYQSLYQPASYDYSEGFNQGWKEAVKGVEALLVEMDYSETLAVMFDLTGKEWEEVLERYKWHLEQEGKVVLDKAEEVTSEWYTMVHDKLKENSKLSDESFSAYWMGIATDIEIDDLDKGLEDKVIISKPEIPQFMADVIEFRKESDFLTGKDLEEYGFDIREINKYIKETKRNII